MSMVRTASAAAHRELQDNGIADKNKALIFAVVSQHPEGMTRREIEQETGLRPNQVSGRVHSLIHDDELLCEDGMKKCPITGRLVNVVKVA